MKAQAFGGLAFRAIWECWNANKFDYGNRFSTGVLFWYHNNANRQVCARLWDWSLEPTAALYFSQTAHQPLHAQFDFLKDTVSVNNELPKEFTGAGHDPRAQPGHARGIARERQGYGARRGFCHERADHRVSQGRFAGPLH